MLTDFNKKGNRDFFNSKLLFKVVGVIFLLVIIFLIFEDIKIYKKKQELISQIGVYQKKIADIKKSSQTLKDEIANSDSTDYLEKIAYEQLGEQKPGEKEIIFVSPPEKTKITVNKPQNFWDKLGSWFSNGFNWIKSKF